MLPRNSQFSCPPRFLLLLLLAVAASFTFAQECQVLNAEGIDVTAELTVMTGYDDGTHYTNYAEKHSAGQVTGTVFQDAPFLKEYIHCQGEYACQNYTFSHCNAIHCDGMEACYQSHLSEIGIILECHGTHACHRTHITFAKDLYRRGSSEDGTDTTNIMAKQTMHCSTAACNAAIIRQGPHLELECRGPKSCRKVAVVNTIHSIHCTEGSNEFEACMDMASFEADCLLCGIRGCNSHVNKCKFKSDALEATFEKCVPESVMGDACTEEQEAKVQQEIETAKKYGHYGNDGGDRRTTRLLRERN
jgi:hypothetical protein